MDEMLGGRHRVGHIQATQLSEPTSAALKSDASILVHRPKKVLRNSIPYWKSATHTLSPLPSRFEFGYIRPSATAVFGEA
jgi:hypothetical protein